MGSDLLKQFGAQRRAVQIAGSAIIALAMIPGLPKLPFLLVGGAVLVIAQRLPKQGDGAKETPEAVAALAAAPSPDSPESSARDMRVEPLELELAYDLIDLVDASTGGDLLDRVRALRRKLALELGIVIPLVRTRDNLDLPPKTYAIRLHGVECAREAEQDQEPEVDDHETTSHSTSVLSCIPSSNQTRSLRSMPAPLVLRPRSSFPLSACGRAKP